jgi:hypothetical protein
MNVLASTTLTALQKWSSTFFVSFAFHYLSFIRSRSFSFMTAGVTYAWASIILLCGFIIIVVVNVDNAYASGALITGYCARCGIKHSLPTTDEAKQAALNLRARMVESGRIDVDELRLRRLQLGHNDNEDRFVFPNHDDDVDDLNLDLDLDLDLDPSLAIERLYERRGKMFGVLVCEVPKSDSDSNSPRDVVTLKAYAGKLGGRWNLPGWAPIVGRVPESLPVFRRLSAEVTEFFGMIDDATRDGGEEHVVVEKVKQLTKERARLSNLALEELRRHQLVTNFRGETLPITAIYARGPTKLPGGVGDCAAPKLLAEAARLGLQPTGISEIFVGATGGMSTTKGDGELYDACEQRCEQIAGFMLCGLNNNVVHRS